ncbi:hypothetical protein L914_15177, partial [Phytophthora nicotianae]
FIIAQHFFQCNTELNFRTSVWEQLTDPARVALNDIYNFGDAEVPFSDNNFEDYLDKAWPF